MKELEKLEISRQNKEKAPQMIKEMEGQMESQGIGGTVEEVRQVYRSPAQREKGENSNVEDARPEEMSEVELHVAMEQYFERGQHP